MTTFKRTRTSRTGRKIVETVNTKKSKSYAATKQGLTPEQHSAHIKYYEDEIKRIPLYGVHPSKHAEVRRLTAKIKLHQKFLKGNSK
jgi:hypothetical protein